MMAGAAGAGGQSSSREFTITLGGVDYPVVIEGVESPPWEIVVNDRSFTVSLGEGGSVLVDGIAYDVTLDGETVMAGGASHGLEVSGFSVGRALPAASPVPAGLAKASRGAGAVVAIMPGQVTRVMVEVGQQIGEGEAVCLLEAMKMENELRAERAGVVRAVHVQPGDDVQKDQVLVEIE